MNILMRNNDLLRVMLFVLTVVLNSAYACLPPLDEQSASIAQKAQGATFVFEGVVTEVADNYVLVSVGQYFKRAGLKEVKITGFNGHICTDYLVLGQRALFFTSGVMGDMLDAVYDSAFGSIRDFNAVTFAEITAARECVATYSSGWLEIPCVVVQGEERTYQAFLEKVEADGRLKLSLVLARPAPKIQEKVAITSVEMFSSALQFGQLIVTVQGSFVDGCERLGSIYISRVEHEFTVTVLKYRVHGVCTFSPVPFKKNISLPNNGLSSGSYNVNVNGVVKEFNLVN